VQRLVPAPLKAALDFIKNANQPVAVGDARIPLVEG
jgi:hypothetical protein